MQKFQVADNLFYRAVQAIDTGNVASLRELLNAHPDLVTERLTTPNDDGYFRDPYLLWFVADNPIRHEKLPANIVEITRHIIETLKKSGDDKYQYIINYALGLVSTGRIPKECGVQIPLMELLWDSGATVKGSVLGPIGQQNFEAARFLLDKGANYNLATAVGFNNLDDTKRLLKTATASELYVALVVASFFGRAEIIALLIEAGVDVNGSGSKEDFGGFHSHATPLHQAVYSGSLDAVKILVEARASLDATDKVYNGTPLGWALYMQTEESDEAKKKEFREIENYLSANRINS